MPPSALYTYFTCNRKQIKDKLFDCGSVNKEQIQRADKTLNSSHNSTLSDVEGIETLEIRLSKAEFDNILEYRLYKRTEKKRRHLSHRQYAVLKPGEWQLLIIDKLWNKYEHTCGYHFKTPNIYLSTSTGTFTGGCNCGSTITGFIKKINEEVIPITCVVTRGNGQCNKRYLRKPERYEIAQELRNKNKSAAVYRCEQAVKKMREGGPEPGHLYTNSVMKNAKKEYVADQHKNSDPVQSLALMQGSSLKEIIHNLGLNPFYVHYWTYNQLHVYRASLKNDHICVAIDATGSIVRKISRVDGTMSHHIFLYECVIHCSTGQFPVAQMLTDESQNTICIQDWLLVWVRSGAPQPKEVVCDASKALLSAAIRAFTAHRTLPEYSEACMHYAPACYVHIDVAHFMKTNAVFLKKIRPRVKKFWLASIAQLVLVRDIPEAEALLRNILIIARSETDGTMDNGQLTQCELSKSRLKVLLTDEKVTSLIPDDVETEDDCDEDDNLDNDEEYSWYQFARNIDENIRRIVQVENGDRDNAHYSPVFADRVINDFKLFPLWSCVMRDQFGYGRVPASSASVESDFNHLKTRVLHDETLPVRVDDFVEKYVKYLTGNMLIVENAACNAGRKSSSLPIESDEEALDDPLTSASLEKSAESVASLDSPNVPERFHKQQTRCKVCADGNIPTGAHQCAICDRPVHVIAGCSVPIDGEDEGYGSKRICQSCIQIQSYQDFENWKNLAQKPGKPVESKELEKVKRVKGTNGSSKSNRGKIVIESAKQDGEQQGEKDPPETMMENEAKRPNALKKGPKLRKATIPAKSKKVSRYLTKNSIENICGVTGKLFKMPILKNGRSLILMPIVIGKENVSLQFTCPHDSIFQLFLCAAIDHETVRTYIERAESHRFFELINSVVLNGVNRRTYELRAGLLRSLFQGTQRPENFVAVDCQTSAETMYKLLMQDSPSFVETTRCSKKCSIPRDTKLEIIHGEHSWLSSDLHFHKMIEENVILNKKRACDMKDCGGSLETTISETGQFIAISIDSRSTDFIELNSIPKNLQ